MTDSGSSSSLAGSGSALAGGRGRVHSRPAGDGSAARPAAQRRRHRVAAAARDAARRLPRRQRRRRRRRTRAEQIEAQQLDRAASRPDSSLALLEPVARSPDRGDDARGTRAPSSSAPTRGSAPGSSGRRCSRNLRNACAVWFFLFGGKSRRAQHEAGLAAHRGQHRSSWRLRPPPCVGRLQRKTRPSCASPFLWLTVKSIAGRSSPSSSALDRELRSAPPHSSLASAERADEHVEQLVVVGRDLGFGCAGSAPRCRG